MISCLRPFIAFAFAAWCLPGHAAASVCSAAYADSLVAAQDFRNVMDMCDIGSDGFARALYHLNALPPPSSGPRISLQPSVTGGGESQAILEADIFFNWLETYPPEAGLTRLANLVASINRGYLLGEIQITASMDETEGRLSSLQIAHRRAEFVRSYFAAAGAPAADIVVFTKAPGQRGDTAERRARDRVASIKVTTIRQRMPWPWLVTEAVKRNIVWTGEGNPRAELEVRLAPTGVIENVMLSRPSSDGTWDQAVIAAVRKTERLPLDADGRVPAKLVLVFAAKLP